MTGTTTNALTNAKGRDHANVAPEGVGVMTSCGAVWRGRATAATLTSDRATAAKAVVARLREVKRAEVVPSWARQSLPTVIALESDELRDVMVRCTHYDRSVLVGVYYPETGEVEAVEFTPQTVQLEPAEDSTRLGDGVTVGMLLSVIRPDRWARLLERAAPSTVA